MLIGVAQINARVGDFPGNAKRILQAYRSCIDQGAELVVTPELSLVGYPPRDLLRKKRFVEKCLQALDYLSTAVGEVPLIVGYVDYFHGEFMGRSLRNGAAFLHEHKVTHKVWKTLLPNYEIFDESAYFEPSTGSQIIEFGGHKIGLTICEDIWSDGLGHRPLKERDPVSELKENGMDLLINISAAPFYKGRPQKIANVLEVVACGARVPLVYCNAVGANDQMIFDGHSMVLDKEGNEIANLPGFHACTKVVDIRHIGQNPPIPRSQDLTDVYNALVMGVRDYVAKTGYDTVCLGLDGGLDSALLACIAVVALGADKVHALVMSGPHTPAECVGDSLLLAENIGFSCHKIVLNEVQSEAEKALAELFAGLAPDTTEENMESRLRGMALNAYANKCNHLVLSSGNKTDLAVGDFTIYGDRHAGLSVLSDVPKTLVLKLAEWLNEKNQVFPNGMFQREYNREFKIGQWIGNATVLDDVLQLYIEFGLSCDEIIEDHEYDETLVRWVQRKVDLNEWKRRQMAPGLCVTTRVGTMQRRLPIVQGFVD